MNKNNTHTVIQRSEVTKNLGNTHLMYPRSFATLWMTIIMALSFSSCQNEEMPAVAKDALALLPAETPVGVQAELKAESRAAEADANTAYDFTLSIPGGSSSSTSFTGSATVATLGNDFPTLQLKDFNLVEGAGRCVSRWTILEAKKDGYETLTGVARLTADANGLPTLSYNLLHTGAKVTVVLTDGTTSFSTIDGIGATLAVKNSKGVWKYGNATLASHLGDVKELNNDPTADDANMKLAIEADETALAPIAMTATDGSFIAVVPATPDGATLADADVLTITVPDTYAGLTSPQTGGKYTLKLKDVKVVENGQPKPLTAMKSGEHLTLTVTLAHNMKVSATATIGGWDEVSADVDLNDDAAKMQPYTYDAESDTYTVYLAEGLYAWATAVCKAMNDGEETHPNLILAEDITLPAKTNEGQVEAITVTDGVPSGSNWTPVREYAAEGYIIAYKGTIDGRGHTISGLRINSTAGETAFISNLGVHSMVKNLTFADAVVYSSGQYTSILVSSNYEGTVKNCRVAGNSTVTSTQPYVGGIASYNNGIVDNCHVEAGSTITSNNDVVGGIVSDNQGLMMGCTNAAAVKSTFSANANSNYVGGIAGKNTSTIIACANTGAVTNPLSNGTTSGKTYACWSTADRDFETNYGGDTNGKRTACYIIKGNTITKVDNSTAVATISEAVEAMNIAISVYNSPPQGKKCPYTWELPQGESTPKLKKSNL